MHPEVKALIEHYHFQSLPVEGTLFVSTYRSAQEMEGGGPIGTAMIGMYCDEPHSVSLFHKLTTDEVWHFYDGSPLIVYEIDRAGKLKENILGLNVEKGESPVVVIEAGNWFCAELAETNSFTLAGCTVSPGFDFDDFELANKSELSERFPQHKEFIEKFTQ